jgi:hypothetical protein
MEGAARDLRTGPRVSEGGPERVSEGSTVLAEVD